MTNKLTDEWLLSFAAGALNPGRSLMVASHLAYHDDLQDAVAQADAIGGAVLDSMKAADVSDVMLDKLMSRLDDSVVMEVDPVPAGSGEYPKALMEFIDCDLEALNWRFMAPRLGDGAGRPKHRDDSTCCHRHYRHVGGCSGRSRRGR